MSIKSFLITFAWGIGFTLLFFVLIFAALGLGPNESTTTRNTSLFIILAGGLFILGFIVVLTIKAIQDTVKSLKSPSTKDSLWQKPSTYIGSAILLNFVILIYVVTNLEVFISSGSFNVNPLISIMYYVAYGLFIWGVIKFAKHKGYSGWLGFVLGLFTLIGLAIAYFLPNKNAPRN